MTIHPINAAAKGYLQWVAQDHSQFDVSTVDLCTRTMVVEASAGTGKTSTIATLTVRALGEGFCTIDQVMLVTFTIKAAAELRTRVHTRLVEALTMIDRTGSLGEGDPLAPGHRSAPDRFTSNLRVAAAAFDQATIATTHGFCQSMLSTLGVHVDHDPSDTAADSMDVTVAEIAEDLFLRHQHAGDRIGELASVHRLLSEALDRTHIPLRPDQVNTTRGALVEEARTEFERRKRRQQVYGFDDMTGRLQTALAAREDGHHGPARSILSSRYRLVMVDEFQDTDQQQWQLIRDAFHGTALLVLIGDPKQAIYRFRGADVQAYLAAAEHHDRFSLRKNYRSSAEVVTGIDAILNQAQLGSGIQTPTATADEAAGLVDVPDDWAFGVQLRLVGSNADRKKNLFRPAVKDLVAQLGTLFDAAPVIELPRQTPRRLRRRDVAVLVRTHWHAREVTTALNESGLPAVKAGSGGVLAGEAGQAWLGVMDMLLDINSASLRRAALSPLIGWDIPHLVEADDLQFDVLAQTVRELSQLWIGSGFAVMADALLSAFDVHERMLQSPQGAQRLSDLLQVAELAHGYALSHRASPEAVRRWLEQSMADQDETATRVGSDEDAIQVMTIHTAKGLGFPIVLLPDLFVPNRRRDEFDEPRVRHDADGNPMLDVSDEASKGVDEEGTEEDLRIAYVAMTRAQVALRVWWGASDDVHSTALHRLLLHDAPYTLPSMQPQVGKKDQLEVMESHLSAPRFAPVHVVRAPKVAPAQDGAEGAPAPEAPTGSPRQWTRRIDHTWRRTSYSGLTAELHDLAPHPGTPADSDARPADGSGLDEPDLVAADPSKLPRPTEDVITSPLAGVPGGADFGTLVHAILEHVDPQANDLSAEIGGAAAPYLAAFGTELDSDGLVQALVKVFHSPLGALTGGTLADLPAQDRLAELDFELTMGGSTVRRVADLAALFGNRDLLPATDPLAHYGEVLAATPAAEQTLNGFLNGSIDAVLRVGPGGHRRFVVVDYKTNTMPLAPGELLTVQHYDAHAMTQAMVLAHYPLQALIYSVALHRFLGWRLPGYDPEHHLGGVGYLFVRGMAGPATPELGGMPAGVFTWHPPARFVVAADKIFGGER